MSLYEREDRKEESNDNPEIPDMWEDTTHPQPTFGDYTVNICYKSMATHDKLKSRNYSVEA